MNWQQLLMQLFQHPQFQQLFGGLMQGGQQGGFQGGNFFGQPTSLGGNSQWAAANHSPFMGTPGGQPGDQTPPSPPSGIFSSAPPAGGAYGGMPFGNLGGLLSGAPQGGPQQGMGRPPVSANPAMLNGPRLW
jgi:hypothetical protein